MSLVAYNSSDESGDSDAEDHNQVNDVKNDKSVSPANDNISDEDDYVPANTSGQVQAVATAGVVDTDDQVTSLLKGLPAPKAGGQDEVQEDELEEEVKPKSTQIADAPKPPGKKAKMPVKISIPKLDHDSDEEEPVPKKAKTTNTKGKAGLFALLPAPIHVAKKEANRILIPHTLTKRPQKPAPKPPPTKPKQKEVEEEEGDESGFSKRYTAFSGLTGYDSDSDDETTVKSNFFSLDSETVKQNSSQVIANPDIEEPVSIPKPLLSDSVVKMSPKQESSSRTVTAQAVDESVLPAVVSHIPQTETDSASVSLDTLDQPVDQDAPLSFRPTMPQQNLLSAASMGARYQYMHTATSTTQEQQLYPAYPQYLEPSMPYEEDNMVPPQEEFSKYMQDEQFLRLQGKKHRGKEEINIIDANMDDFVSSVDVAKNLTEESSYQSHQKDNNPTQQQRRKKQITYLAFQAKERELELKNSWAQSRMTKRQTQAKYGF